MYFLNKLIDRYRATTPTQWRVAGNFLLQASYLIAGVEAHRHKELIALIVFIIGHAGHLCLNLATGKEKGN
jgi:hypothetical protein